MMEYDTHLDELYGRYAQRKCAIPINFRKKISHLTTERYTHLIHPYPAKLVTHIPYFFLNNNSLSKPGDIVLDPFAGSGTVLLEALLAGRIPVGADTSPLARIIAKVKTTPLSMKKLGESAEKLYCNIPSSPQKSNPDVINMEHWFYPHVIKQLECIREGILKVRKHEYNDFFQVCFSTCVRRVSLADPRVVVPVRLQPERYPSEYRFKTQMEAHLRKLKRINVFNVFKQIVQKNIKRMSTLSGVSSVNCPMIFDDAKELSQKSSDTGSLPDSCVQLIITSPPYPGAQKYIRSVGLSMGWLDLCKPAEIKDYKKRTIGREEYARTEYSNTLLSTGIPEADNKLKKIRQKNPLRAHIAGAYLVEMRQAFSEMSRVLKSGGFVVLVAANNQICGSTFKTVRYLQYILEDLNFSLELSLIDDIHSRGLMTKRNKTASMINSEYVMLFKKRG